jgi:hypothetical protein
MLPIEGRFWSKVKVDPATKCWVWQGSKSDGYGNMRQGRKVIKTYRWSYERYVGMIPEGLTIDHLCRNRACVNPAHLEPVTLQENLARARRALQPKKPIKQPKPAKQLILPIKDVTTPTLKVNGRRRNHTCLVCENSIVAARSDAKYCSLACRIKACRQRKKAA